MRKKTALDDWIREALVDPDKTGPCSAISLVHMFGGGAMDEIHTVKMGNREVTETELAVLFKHKAETYAQELPGVQSFCLLAFYKNGDGSDKSEPEARHPFRVTGETDFGGMATEAANEFGFRQQGMRLTEAIVQGSFKQNSLTFDTLIRTTEMTNRYFQQSMKQNEIMMNLIREMMVENIQLKHDHRMQELNREMVGKMVGYLPPLANQVLGAEVFPQAKADTSILEALAEHVTEENLPKIQAIVTAVNPTIWPILASRLNQILEEKKKKKLPKASIQVELEDEEISQVD